MNKKTGISLIVLVVMIIVMIVLATAVVTISVNAVYNSKKTSFANDLATVQQAVIDYYVSTGALPASARTYTLVDFKNIPATTAKRNELATALSETGDTGTFYVVDLSKIGVTSSTRGTKYNVSNDTDVYVVNAIGTKVYYPLGMTVGSVTYFALTNNLTQATKVVEPTITSTTPEGTVNKIRVSKSTNSWSNSITISVVATDTPNTGTCSFLGAGNTTYGASTWGANLGDSGTTRSGSAVFDSSSISSLGTTASSFTSNKILYIKVMRGTGYSHETTISLANFDCTVPAASASYNSTPSYNLVTITATDSESGIKEVRYEYVTKYKTSGNVNYYGSTTIDQAYLLTSGKTGNLQFKVPKDVAKLRYIVLDNAGNYTAVKELTISDVQEVTILTPVTIVNDDTKCHTYEGKNTGFAYNNPVIPPGFEMENVSGASWDNCSNGVCTDYNKGLTITRGGISYVWIPCTVEGGTGIPTYVSNATLPTQTTVSGTDIEITGWTQFEGVLDAIGDTIELIYNFQGFWISTTSTSNAIYSTQRSAAQNVASELLYVRSDLPNALLWLTAISQSYFTGNSWLTSEATNIAYKYNMKNYELDCAAIGTSNGFNVGFTAGRLGNNITKLEDIGLSYGTSQYRVALYITM